MRLTLLVLFIIPTLSFAQNSRSPAVLPSCKIDLENAFEILHEAQDVLSDKLVEEFNRQECLEIRNCLASVDEEDLEKLQKIENFVCKN